MHEALAASIDYGINVLQLETIDGYTHQHNEASVKLLLKMVLCSNLFRGKRLIQIVFILC